MLLHQTSFFKTSLFVDNICHTTFKAMGFLKLSKTFYSNHVLALIFILLKYSIGFLLPLDIVLRHLLVQFIASFLGKEWNGGEFL